MRHYQETNQTAPMYGEIAFMAPDYAPTGWVPCDGRLLEIYENNSLYPLLGSRFGGDGQKHFAVPNLKGQAGVPSGILPIIARLGSGYPQPVDPRWGSGNAQSDAFVGQINYFPYDFLPQGWLRCDGALLDVKQHHVLFYLLTNRFGGDGQQHFALPNLVDAPTTPAGLIPAICESGFFPQATDKSTPEAADPQREAYVGQIIYAAFPQIPSGWWPCDGSLLPIERNVALFSTFWDRFGGNQQTSFALPNLTADPAVPQGVRPLIALGGNFPARG